MSTADILILLFIILILASIIFFSFVLPKILHKKKNHCSSCAIGKDRKFKRAFKDYHKLNK